MKKIVIVFLMALCMPFYTVYAQDCSDRIQSAGKLYDKYKKSKDRKQLEEARKLLINITNTPNNPEKCRESDAPMNKGGGSGMVSGRETSPPQKKRNGFVTFFLILMTFNIFFAFYYLFAAREVMWTYPNSGHLDDMMFSEQPKLDLYYYSSYVMAMLSGLNGAAAVLLLLWKKIGFWLAVASAVCMFILMILFSAIGGVSPMVAFSMMGALLGPVVLWAILQIRRDGVSCWKLLS